MEMPSKVLMDLGSFVKTRRGEMGMSLSELSRAMDGSPVESFLSRLERGQVPIPREAAIKLARILSLPEEEVLNMSGHVTEEQALVAAQRLERAMRDRGDIPKVVEFPVLNTLGRRIGRRRQRVTGDVEGFMLSLAGPPNEPYAGEAIVRTDRHPQDGQGVIVDIKGELSAWTYHVASNKAWIENGRGERRGAGYKIRGVISRIFTERVLD